ncbi:MAG: hypothetical protein AAGG48_11510 [Planctomycetota bacterium]
MSFDEIQSIWKSQKPVESDGDSDGLADRITTMHRSHTRMIGLTEFVMTGVLLFLGFMFMKDPILQGHDRVLLVAGFASLAAAGWVWTGRIARKKRLLRYENTLLGIVEQSIDGISYQIRRMRNFVWWFIAPTTLGLLIGLVIVDDSKRYLFYTFFIPAYVVCMVMTYWQIRREIALKLTPEKERLIELRHQLMEEQA